MEALTNLIFSSSSLGLPRRLFYLQENSISGDKLGQSQELESNGGASSTEEYKKNSSPSVLCQGLTQVSNATEKALPPV